MTRNTRKGFTLIELLVVISIIALLIGILLPALQRAKKNANALKDGTQLKQIHLAMTTYATSNGDRYPIPESIDRQGYTEGAPLFEGMPGDIDEERYRKNRTGAIFSILVFNATIVPDICISPNEPNGGIESDGDYHYAPTEGDQTGVNSGLASWDPSFVGTPATDDAARDGFVDDLDESILPSGGNFSYAHTPLDFASRQSRFWSNRFRAADPVMSNRGPVFTDQSSPGGAGVQVGDTPTNGTWFLAGGADTLLGEQSDALSFAGPTNSWAGNVVYGDNHVSLENAAQPESVTFTDFSTTPGERLSVLDNLFVDESNENGDAAAVASRRNAYLRMYGDGIDYLAGLDETSWLEPIWIDGNEELGER